jgi:hypothetical protein
LTRYVQFLFLALFISFPTVFARAIPADTTVVAGKKYDKSFLHHIFFGKHYREVWAEPVTVPFLNLQTEAGGLKPLLKGGSYQTKNLRMVNPEGREYVLRSIDKDPSQSLSPEMQHSLIGRLVRDQTSVIHPYGAFIIPPLAKAAGIYHTNPKLLVVPDDPALGEFRAEFANMLVLLEERPEGDQRNTENFGNSEEVVSSRKMFGKLIADNKNRVDARAYLRARLFDMWIGDWSRREDQWRWASYELPGKGRKYVGIPRDRDHAFFKFDDGIITWLASKYSNNLQSFRKKIKNLDGLNKTAAPMDNSLLVFLTREDFKQIGDSLKMQLTDEVIENAVRSWPPNIYALTGKEFETKLKNRRNQLPKVAEKYYEILAKDVKIHGTDEEEIFRLTYKGKELLVEMLRPAKKEKPEQLIASRTFKHSETKKLKIYGLGDEDLFEIRGEGKAIKRVRLYDGEDQDSVSFSATKIRRIKFMDSGDGNVFPTTKLLKVIPYDPKADEFSGDGWLLRHRLY